MSFILENTAEYFKEYLPYFRFLLTDYFLNSLYIQNLVCYNSYCELNSVTQLNT
jgi:hypothetical protein